MCVYKGNVYRTTAKTHTKQKPITFFNGNTPTLNQLHIHIYYKCTQTQFEFIQICHIIDECVCTRILVGRVRANSKHKVNGIVTTQIWIHCHIIAHAVFEAVNCCVCVYLHMCVFGCVWFKNHNIVWDENSLSKSINQNLYRFVIARSEIRWIHGRANCCGCFHIFFCCHLLWRSILYSSEVFSTDVFFKRCICLRNNVVCERREKCKCRISVSLNAKKETCAFRATTKKNRRGNCQDENKQNKHRK